MNKLCDGLLPREGRWDCSHCCYSVIVKMEEHQLVKEEFNNLSLCVHVFKKKKDLFLCKYPSSREAEVVMVTHPLLGLLRWYNPFLLLCPPNEFIIAGLLSGEF